MTTYPRQHTAWVLPEFGAPELFERRTLPVPPLERGHVLVRVAATSVNPADLKIRDGRSVALAPPAPMVLHMDVAGTVEAVAEDVTTLAVGDRVFGCVGGVRGTPGAVADHVVADARLLARAPATLPLGAAAALPLVALTAWEGLRWKTRLRPGDRVLVHGGTGGVGHIAVQLAKRDGAEVAATASSEAKLHVARGLGADHVVNHRTPTGELVERLTGGRGFDVVVDTAGGEALGRALEVARPNGTVVSIMSRGTYDLTPMLTRGLSLHVVFMLLPLLTGEGRERHGAMLREVAAAVDAGWLRPVLDDSSFTFDDLAAAHRRVEQGAHRGKVVLTHPEVHTDDAEAAT